jgi:hypothetical protein
MPNQSACRSLEPRAHRFLDLRREKDAKSDPFTPFCAQTAETKPFCLPSNLLNRQGHRATCRNSRKRTQNQEISADYDIPRRWNNRGRATLASDKGTGLIMCNASPTNLVETPLSQLVITQLRSCMCHLGACLGTADIVEPVAPRQVVAEPCLFLLPLTAFSQRHSGETNTHEISSAWPYRLGGF